MATIASFKATDGLYALSFREDRYYFTKDWKDAFSPTDTTKLTEGSGKMKRPFKIFVEAAHAVITDERQRDSVDSILAELKKAAKYGIKEGQLTKDEAALIETVKPKVRA